MNLTKSRLLHDENTFVRLEIEEDFFSSIKGNYRKLMANIILNAERLKLSP